MITIAKIKRSDFHVTIELDNGDTLKIPHQAANPYKLEAGRIIDINEYSQLKTEAQRYGCKRKALDYLAIRARSAFEMERYLMRKGFPHDIIREILNGIAEAGYINDDDYARRYIKSRMGKKLIGKHLLASELRKKGISKNIISQALRETAPSDHDIEEIYEVAMKKYQVLKLKTNGLAKLASFLQRRGFGSEIIAAVIERIIQSERQTD